MTATLDLPKIIRDLNSDVDPQDPDAEREEYDCWIASSCGRSRDTVTLSVHFTGRVDFGPWEGEVCMIGCLEFRYCRVGSCQIHRQSLTGFVPLPIEPGTQLLVDIVG